MGGWGIAVLPALPGRDAAAAQQPCGSRPRTGAEKQPSSVSRAPDLHSLGTPSVLLVSRSAKRFGVWEPWGSSSGVPIPGKASGAHSQLPAYLASGRSSSAGGRRGRGGALRARYRSPVGTLPGPSTPRAHSRLTHLLSPSRSAPSTAGSPCSSKAVAFPRSPSSLLWDRAHLARGLQTGLSAGQPSAMRISPKRSLTAVFAASFFLLLLLLLLHRASWQQQDFQVDFRDLPSDTVLKTLKQGALHIHQDTDSLSALNNISYHLLAGSPSSHKKFLAVGLSSVRRPRGYYLRDTLQSLFKQSSEEELQEMVVVVHLADANLRWNAHVAADISQRFSHHILLGRLVLIHAPHVFYPTLEGLKRNYNDPEARVKFRSKQNVDYAYLVTFAANLSSYYLMIEDDVLSAKSFFTAIRKAVASQEGSNWATLEFSKLGYIGKLYRSTDLPRLARFLLLFYQEMPCDWLLDHFRLLLTQKDVIRFKPSLFQHMGLYSSFQGSVNRLEDDEFEADAMDLPDNPPAAVFTNMLVFENYEPSKAYSTAQGYFWGKNPAVGSIFCIVFHQPARVTRVRVQTGSNERHGDFLRAGVLELGQRRRADGRDCSVYTTVGTFEKGNLERRGLEKAAPNPVECVRIRVTQSQSEWLIIQSIDIWTAGT